MEAYYVWPVSYTHLKYSATGDGILTSLMLMEACVEKKTTLCDLAKEMKVYPQILRNVRVADKVAARENPKVKAVSYTHLDVYKRQPLCCFPMLLPVF